jgi:hypothetical protein
MARERMTRRHTASNILADIDALERRFVAELDEDDEQVTAGIDEELEGWADDIAAEERTIAEKSTGEDTGAATDDQNDKANDNWPTNASELSKEERHKLANELTQLSKGMAKRIAQNGSLSEKERCFVASKLLSAAKRIG